MTKPKFKYDEMRDTFYVSFEPGTEATGIELNEHILLRINMGCGADVSPSSMPIITELED